ncbi:3-(cis-5,6-dihydroxycyclohexa-1,3-dien-1-yl)propanoate dehydrogenase [Mycolicibacterium mucogenicum]|uniref:3-(Cis-5,6-dihydroxycyclohexa-1, 3-dien-1-yl)propanoate dehydrogenase n=1 Tax=Mycolicibacterium mucogenicum TaxID=56689 RepID=A0A1A3H3L9_MYCMU|nr:3-(cis-5,6-dihydroxycyclohexa-1,3-dien-1-yl)propanoate dehydrogenase [Mycolicibacterium mucogenicum]OBJ42236.1 3-(cis-5,6-dihydroxycyclohexa-1,3-dien-1-yl)propanoate dehydrogenase [Mycolicibacterium mucogenicum]
MNERVNDASQGRLSGRVAVITGGGAGIGRAIVDRFIAEGACVAVLEVSEQRLRDLADTYPEDVLAVAGDATRLADNIRVVEAATERFGHLDCFVANTGYWDFGISLEQLPDDEHFDHAFDQIFALNVKAFLSGAKAAMPALSASRGSLIMTASNASMHPGGGGPLYTSSKHAVIGLVRQLAYELAPDIRVNAVAPGGMLTSLTGPPALATPTSSISDLPMDKLISIVSPLGFLPEPADYTGWYVALASARDARTITGATIECDGGERVRGRAFSEYARMKAADVRVTSGGTAQRTCSKG